MSNELKELMQEVGRKWTEQREIYERKLTVMKNRLNELERELVAKNETTLRLTEENEKLRQKILRKEKSTTTNVGTEPVVSWDSILEDELRQRLEAFVELCREASVDDSFLSDVFKNTKKINRNSLENNKKFSKETKLKSPPSFEGNVFELERSLTRRYDQLAADATNLLNKNSKNNNETI